VLKFEETSDSFDLEKLDATGRERELLCQLDEESPWPVVMIVYNEAEHCMIALDRVEARRLAGWLAGSLAARAG
jgi:hypothetical protein